MRLTGCTLDQLLAGRDVPIATTALVDVLLTVVLLLVFLLLLLLHCVFHFCIVVFHDFVCGDSLQAASPWPGRYQIHRERRLLRQMLGLQ